MLRLEGVGKRYGRGRLVLSEVELTLPGGQTTVVRGRNGSGKSTLLRVVAGVCQPSLGRVRGRPAQVGYVPERFPAHLRLSPRDYLRHLGALRGQARAVTESRIEELLTRLAFAGEPDEPMNRLSKGNTQKIAVTQALLAPTGLLVLDEPWAGLDTTAAGVLGELLAEAAAAGTNVLLIDHEEHHELIRRDRLVEIADGRIRVHETSHDDLVELTLRVPAHRADALRATARELGGGEVTR
ncbi:MULTISPECIES: ATP-binding cassette domain-containing protein [unclassified Crossiella]|uniref:ABC transporter ATP-binding protein n=1 Tax=unclassified Crossiella TaxID=2620835 RepID=UPI001FFF6048|nr:MULTISPECIES: ATP-binding cassette domain-containing protein [unclassified Crossiella]MCK2242082.1 ATP-binding cassette domain-containing protein [Crossiella sp. S99.2]MCK2255985.1 ATP-binding cassette domain-containing protein [Crossiella sp. S99.1]